MSVPLSELRAPHPLSRKQVCPSPGTKGGERGHTRLRVRGPQFGRLGDKSSTVLCLLCDRRRRQRYGILFYEIIYSFCKVFLLNRYLYCLFITVLYVR